MAPGIHIMKIPFIFPWLMPKRKFKVIFSNNDTLFLKYEIGNCRISLFDTNLFDLTSEFKSRLKAEIRSRKHDKIFMKALKTDFYIGPHVLIFELMIRFSNIFKIILLPIIYIETFQTRD